MPDRPKIGVVLARTGRLASLGAPLEFAAGMDWPFEVVRADSRSSANGARLATEELARRDRVNVVVTLGGSATLPAVADTCERLAIPCLSTTLPWQVYYYRRATAGPFEWTYHVGWGLDDIAATFADMWHRVASGGPVGCLWNDGYQGEALRDPVHGFAPVAVRRGYRLIDRPGYAEPAAGFGAQITAFAKGGVRIVTSAATAADLAAFTTLARGAGLVPELVTCSRWLTYPFGVDRYGLGNVATIVYWTPAHRYRSALGGLTPAELADRYEWSTGRAWSQPLGPAYALFEVAARALAGAHDPTDPAAVAGALTGTRVETVAGTLDWTGGPVPNVAAIPLAGGQWRAGGRPELVVVTNERAPAVPVSADLVVSR